MKRNLLLLLLTIFLLSACSQKARELSTADETEKIENLLEKYMIAIENEDDASIENIWDVGDSTMLLGTDSHERLMGWKSINQAYKNQFGLIDETFISIQDQFIRVSCSGKTAWFSQRMNYNFIYDSIARSFEGIRFTGVLQKNKDQEWKIVQGHLSVPAQVNIGK